MMLMLLAQVYIVLVYVYGGARSMSHPWYLMEVLHSYLFRLDLKNLVFRSPLLGVRQMTITIT